MKHTTKDPIVYVIHAQGTNFVKIGVTTRLTSRLSAIRTGCPYPCAVAHTWPGAYQLESELHERFAAQRREGEWFEFEGATIQEVVSIIAEAMVELSPPVTIYDVRPSVVAARDKVIAIMDSDDVAEKKRIGKEVLRHLNLAVRAMATDDLALLVEGEQEAAPAA